MSSLEELDDEIRRYSLPEDDEYDDEEALAESIYPVKCLSCGWAGMSDDCAYLRCPFCGARVTRGF